MSSELRTEAFRSLPEGTAQLTFTSTASLLEYFEVLIDILLHHKPAYAVVQLTEDAFIQVMALDDGELRLESSAGLDVIAANLGFSQLVEQHEHIAALNIPTEWSIKDKVAAETMMTLAIDVHRISLPAEVEISVAPVD